jgi:hypothetical protein
MADDTLLPMDKSCGDLRQFFGRNGTRKVNVPPEYSRRTHQRERESNYRTWKLSTGCDVLAYGDKYSNTVTRFEIFGSSMKVEQAVSEVNEWIHKANTKTPHSTVWSKIKAFDPIQYGYDILRAEDAQRKETFKGPPPEDTKDLFKVGRQLAFLQIPSRPTDTL